MTFALVTCSGISNTGKLTTQAAQSCSRENRALRLDACQAVCSDARSGDRGCRTSHRDRRLHGLLRHKETFQILSHPHRHIIATELGIEKNGMGEVQYDEIEKVVRAVMNNGSQTP